MCAIAFVTRFGALSSWLARRGRTGGSAGCQRRGRWRLPRAAPPGAAQPAALGPLGPPGGRPCDGAVDTISGAVYIYYRYLVYVSMRPAI
jgi:hypothetical protein